VISNIAGVRAMAKRMLAYAAKKRIELEAVLEYYDDRITGDQFVDTVNRLVRWRKNWQVQRPWT